MAFAARVLLRQAARSAGALEGVLTAAPSPASSAAAVRGLPAAWIFGPFYSTSAHQPGSNSVGTAEPTQAGAAGAHHHVEHEEHHTEDEAISPPIPEPHHLEFFAAKRAVRGSEIHEMPHIEQDHDELLSKWRGKPKHARSASAAAHPAHSDAAGAEGSGAAKGQQAGQRRPTKMGGLKPGHSARGAILEDALHHVPRLGWTHAALVAATQDLGLSSAATGLVGHNDAEFVQAFGEHCNHQLEKQLAGMKEELAGMKVRDRVRTGVQLRLEMLAPFIDTWPSALALLSQPRALQRTLRMYSDIADIIWHAAGDKATDLNWYTKRGLLVGVYTTTELYMLTDNSPGYADTWAALDRRIEDALALGSAARDPGQALASLGSVVGEALGQAAKLAADAPGIIGRVTKP